MQFPMQQLKVDELGSSICSAGIPETALPRSEPDGVELEGATRILSREIKLPSPPAVAIRILNAFKKDDVSSEELVRIVSSDPALALKVLKLANSAIYSRAGKIETIKKAISVLGTRVLKNIALSFVVVDGMCTGRSSSFDFESFWRRSITAAVSACVVAQLLGQADEDLFMSALLQDIGEVILHQHDPERHQKLPHQADPKTRIAAELETFGVDHQEMGFLVLSRWELPSPICDLVRCHHVTDPAPGSLSMQLSLLRLANKLAEVFHGQRSGNVFEDFTSSLRTVYPASHEEIERTISAAHEKRFIRIMSTSGYAGGRAEA